MNGGGTIGYTSGDTTRLLEDAQLIKPEFMAGVPRVWNRYVLPLREKKVLNSIRINAAIKTQLAAGGLKGALLKKAVDAKLHNWRTTGQVTHKVYDALVFRKVGCILLRLLDDIDSDRLGTCSEEISGTCPLELLPLLRKYTRSSRSVSRVRLFRDTV